jgi:hypothetical protein
VNLKFTNLITTTSRVSVRNNNESEREGAKQIMSEERARHDDLFYRGSVLFQPFPSLKRSLRLSELLFSIKRDTKSPQGSPHNWCLLPRLQLSCHKKNEKEKKKSKRKSSNKHNKSLSLITKALCGVGRGFDHFGVSSIEC